MGNQDVVTVLAVSPFEDDHSSLRQIFQRSRWIMSMCQTCAEARTLLKQTVVSVIMCEQRLPDGDWKDVLEDTRDAVNPPPLIVTSRLADDRLWSEVLNLGAYDLLSKPFRQSEVFRDVTLAFLHWKNQWRVPVQARRAV